MMQQVVVIMNLPTALKQQNKIFFLYLCFIVLLKIFKDFLRMIFYNESFSIFLTVIKNDRWSSKHVDHVDHSLDEIFGFGHSNRFLVMLTTEMTMKMVDSFADQCGLESIIWTLKKKF